MQNGFKRLKVVPDKLNAHALSLERIVAALLTSFMFSYIYVLLGDGKFANYKEYYLNINLGWFFAIALLAFAALVGSTYLSKCRYIIPWMTIAAAVTTSVLLAANYPSEEIIVGTSYNSSPEAWTSANLSYVFFAIGVGVFDFIVVKWLVKDDKLGLSLIRIDRKIGLIIACLFFVVSTIVFGYFTSLKYRTYSDSVFDFGIFAQMYERMAASGLPNTTVERSHMMSHFGVHFSPVFYLFLPFYWIFRTPVFLFYLQAAAVAAGVFAVYLICGKLGLSGKMTLALELIYAFYPCLFSGVFYDFHENKFLTTIILFLFYFIISKRTLWTFVFSLLLLSVKEDAAIYLICIALFVMIYRKEILRGAGMLAMAIVYFILANAVVSAMGEGVMMNRLGDYFLNGEQTYGSVIRTIFYDMGYLIKQCFKADKIPFIMWMFAPVIFTPFMNKKISALILLLPILPINIMQSWNYQWDVDYQYTYGIAALIFMSAVFVIVQLKTDWKRVIVMTSVILCLVMSVALVFPKLKHNSEMYKNFSQSWTEDSQKEMDDMLASIPSDASVTTASHIAPHLYRIERLYHVYPYNEANLDIGDANDRYPTDYYVIDSRFDASQYREHMKDNYEKVDSAGFLELYKRKVTA